MTNTHHNFGRVVALTAVFLALLACTVVVPAVAQTPPSISKNELKTLLATSHTAADQERFAAYYRDKAQQLRARAQEFAAEADYLATQPSTIESKQGISCNCTSHYRYYSKIYAREAKDAEALAAQHHPLAPDSQSKAAQP